MNTIRAPSAQLPSASQLAAAPHRLMFFIGALNVLAAMAWWTAWLADARWHLFGFAASPVPAGWAHAFVMQYQVLPPFMFGFLLTVFPRWMGLPELTRWHYVPVGLGLLLGQVLFLVGLWGYPVMIHLGTVCTIAGWLAALAMLLRLLWLEAGRTWHAISCAAALVLGLAGLVLFAFFLHVGDFRLWFASVKLGSFGLLLPIYITVAHRMFPFFAGNVVKGYAAWRPLGFLLLFWAFTLIHLGLEIAQAYAWFWLCDIPLLGLTAFWLWRNWPRGPAPALLRVLFLGFAWLPFAFALYAVQSLWFVLEGALVLGRGPAHAMYVGFFGSLLVAMVTRVTQGHSGRPLELGRVATFAFIVIQAVAVIRVSAELLPDSPFWQALAGAGWLAAFLPWVLRSTWIYLTPRRDGRPG